MFTLIKLATNHSNAIRGYLVLPTKNIHTTNVLAAKVAGRHKITVKRDKPLTYEQANKPDQIGVRKSWNSINSSNLFEGVRTATTTHEDIFIRKFVHGTWPKLLASDVIIKRRGNLLVLNLIVVRAATPSSIYFLTGYTEEILTYLLKCVVKLEIQTIENEKELVYKYI